MAIIDISGFAAKPDAKAFAPSPPKMETAWANNVEHSGNLMRFERSDA